MEKRKTPDFSSFTSHLSHPVGSRRGGGGKKGRWGVWARLMSHSHDRVKKKGKGKTGPLRINVMPKKEKRVSYCGLIAIPEPYVSKGRPPLPSVCAGRGKRGEKGEPHKANSLNSLTSKEKVCIFSTKERMAFGRTLIDKKTVCCWGREKNPTGPA